MIRPIVQLGAPVLKALARPLDHPELAEAWALSLVRDMFATLEDAGGVGLAAPQVGVSVRVILAGSFPTPRAPDRPLVPDLGAHQPAGRLVLGRDRAGLGRVPELPPVPRPGGPPPRGPGRIPDARGDGDARRGVRLLCPRPAARDRPPRRHPHPRPRGLSRRRRAGPLPRHRESLSGARDASVPPGSRRRLTPSRPSRPDGHERRTPGGEGRRTCPRSRPATAGRRRSRAPPRPRGAATRPDRRTPPPPPRPPRRPRPDPTASSGSSSGSGIGSRSGVARRTETPSFFMNPST